MPTFEVDFFAPHNKTGQRFKFLPSFDPDTRVVTATTLGVYLFQVRLVRQYIVGRLQVHSELEDWWFGNDSITTALDPPRAHALPSIYARFKPDDKGTDLVGDITGHRYIALTSTAPGKVVPTPEGRLRGVAETEQPVNISGTFQNGRAKMLPVRVVNYAKKRRDLLPVQTQDVPRAPEMHNIVFISEGFREEDRERFDRIVARTRKAMFTKDRHEPYGLLEHSFNVFKAFAPSQENMVTCAFKVTDTSVPEVPKGRPIPFDDQVSATDDKFYTMEQLVSKVGLPMRDEKRNNLPDIWRGQSLDDFHAERVNPELVNAWKAQQSVGILHARDTFFGLQLGCRWADRSSAFPDAEPVRPPPDGDTPGPALSRFVARLYEFYSGVDPHIFGLDPRRHAPEVCTDPANNTDPGNLVMSYLSGLEYAVSPFPLIGPLWAPDDENFKPSRGMVIVIVNETMNGGTAIKDSTITAATCNKAKVLEFVYGDPNVKPGMRRPPKADVVTDFIEVANTVAHELGHGFNLDDEYESAGGLSDDAGDLEDSTKDNVAVFGFIQFGTNRERKIDPSKVKWLALPRMRLSDRLIAPLRLVPGGVEVTIDKGQLAKWAKMKAENAQVHLRRRNITPDGQQLPLTSGAHQVHEALSIASINEAAGTMVLAGPNLPPVVFEQGSTIFVPLKDGPDHPLLAVEAKVLEHLNRTRLPLNSDPDTSAANEEPDGSVSIPGFKAPCIGSELIGIFEGAARFAGGMYRPAGDCKMRNQGDAGFCFVCKWLIVNRVNPGRHGILSKIFYPKAK
ncbi:M64 family metallopeptidase [Actinomadura vinacea]|uniref:M64 family metallopeptidase n=1 Tax=Actinomadura vinacea TaxID=115336 RepID=UPI0031E2BAF7